LCGRFALQSDSAAYFVPIEKVPPAIDRKTAKEGNCLTRLP
jgi:hypothetical protein